MISFLSMKIDDKGRSTSTTSEKLELNNKHAKHCMIVGKIDNDLNIDELDNVISAAVKFKLHIFQKNVKRPDEGREHLLLTKYAYLERRDLL
jgi:hypothetical protein